MKQRSEDSTPMEPLAQLRWAERLARHLALDQGGNAGQASDLVHDAWILAHGGGSASAAERLKARAWWVVVLRNLVRGQRRGEQSRSLRERRVSRSEEQPSTFEVVERSALCRRIQEAVHALPEPYRATVLYRYFDGLSPSEIALRMGTDSALVRQRLARGLKKLRVSLAKEGRSEGLASCFGLWISQWWAPLGSLVRSSSARSLNTRPLDAAAAATAEATVSHAMLPTLQLTVAAASFSCLLGLPEVLTQPAGQEAPGVLVQAAPAAQASSQVVEVQETAAVRRAVTPPSVDQTLARAAAQIDVRQPHGQASDRLLPQPDFAKLPCSDAEASSCANCHLPDSNSQFDALLIEGGNIVFGQDLTLDGFTKVHKHSGQREEGELAGGQREGVWNTLQADGAVVESGSYLAGWREGAWRSFHPGGELESEGAYQFGEKQGLWRSYHPGGQLAHEASYSHGRLHGLERMWSTEGQLVGRWNHRYGRKHGLAETWHVGGQAASRGEYQYGTKVGAWKAWDEAGAEIVAELPVVVEGELK